MNLKQRIAILGLGHVGNFLFGWLINWGVDPFVTLLLNYHIGGVTGMLITWASLGVISFIACYATLKFYDWSKTDWLGVEAIKSLKEELDEAGNFKRWVAEIARKGDPLSFILLSLVTDPFIVVIYMRRGANHYNGLTRRDWILFVSSILICNGWETVYLYGGLEGIKKIFGIDF